MKSFLIWIFCSLIIITTISADVEGRRLVLRPLTKRELRNALEESGIGSETAAGKSVASAFAGLSGLALGITKGIGGSILFDVVTSNVTIDYITSLLNATASSTTSSSSGTAQEICFNSRSVNGDDLKGGSKDNALVDDNVYSSEEWRQLPSSSSTDNSWTVINGPTDTTAPTTTTDTNSGKTCIVLGSKGHRRRRQLEIRPGTLSYHASRRLRKFHRNRF
ncbi:uncharacterized protein LOC110182877 [Drosophila serrata]|uniref:uncharacterized protein LOC110182877 n=1 Tax=Drosophila serrata TaxID=7274 RepID=UPI000A1CF33F|nr:uncharacterized protein LOC110182877 [Drosophila serrata]